MCARVNCVCLFLAFTVLIVEMETPLLQPSFTSRLCIYFNFNSEDLKFIITIFVSRDMNENHTPTIHNEITVKTLLMEILR